ncbi:MAG: hypothetical protein D6689_01050 [Deltaproteobacteria bacterium]|nr:MAG: hypothetical protein D6689_01050 [Deltaproteobacteria bacterium]
MTRRAAHFAGYAAVVALAVAAWGAAGAPWPASGVARSVLVPGDPLRDLLGGVDYVPDRAALDGAIAGSPTDVLVALAQDAAADPGVRVRAVRALGLYPSDATRSALAALVAALRSSEAGYDLVLLRAALLSLGAVGGAGAAAAIAPALHHPSKDIRAAAATALGATGDKDAVAYLYEQLATEQDELVRQAISEALRRLGGG